MCLVTRRCNSKFSILPPSLLVEPRNQIARQEWTIASGTQYPLRLGPVCSNPVEPGQNSGEGTGKVRNAIRDHRQAELSEAGRIAIGVQD